MIELGQVEQFLPPKWWHQEEANAPDPPSPTNGFRSAVPRRAAETLEKTREVQELRPTGDGVKRKRDGQEVRQEQGHELRAAKSQKSPTLKANRVGEGSQEQRLPLIHDGSQRGKMN